MGKWGFGIFDDDLAVDIRDLYDDLVLKGCSDIQTTVEILDLHHDSMDDSDDKLIIYSALSSIQLSRSSLNEHIRDTTLSLIENQVTNKKNGVSKDDLKTRLYELDKLARFLRVAEVTENQKQLSESCLHSKNKISLQYSVYQLTDSSGKVVYVGTTAFPKKRLRYMSYIDVEKKSTPKSFLGFFGLSKTKEEEFWEWFSENEVELFMAEDTDDTLMYELTKRLQKVNQGLSFEFSSSIDGKKIMAISANGNPALFPLIIKLTNEIKLLTKWIVVPFRKRIENISDCAIRLGDIVIKASDVYYTYKHFNSRIDLDLYVAGVDEINSDIENGVFFLLDSTIGEFDAVTLLGDIKVVPFASIDISDHAKNLSTLIELVAE
jgi:hypothetical protein